MAVACRDESGEVFNLGSVMRGVLRSSSVEGFAAAFDARTGDEMASAAALCPGMVLAGCLDQLQLSSGAAAGGPGGEWSGVVVESDRSAMASASLMGAGGSCLSGLRG